MALEGHNMKISQSKLEPTWTFKNFLVTLFCVIVPLFIKLVWNAHFLIGTNMYRHLDFHKNFRKNTHNPHNFVCRFISLQHINIYFSLYIKWIFFNDQIQTYQKSLPNARNRLILYPLYDNCVLYLKCYSQLRFYCLINNCV